MSNLNKAKNEVLQDIYSEWSIEDAALLSALLLKLRRNVIQLELTGVYDEGRALTLINRATATDKDNLQVLQQFNRKFKGGKII